MADIVSPAKRSQMMSGIRGKNTRIELLLRSELHKIGFRFRLHVRNIPGKPDLVFPKYSVVIFVNGCFWHQHNCHLFKWPSTRREFWRAKLNRNQERDIEVRAQLLETNWRVLTVWECALKGRTKRASDDVVRQCADFLTSESVQSDITGCREHENAA